MSDSDSERGGFIPPSNVYCDPEKSNTDSDWVIRSTEELERDGMYRCPICFGPSDTETSQDGGSR